MVIEATNSRGVVYQRYIFNVTPFTPQVETITLDKSNNATLTIPEGATWERKGDDVVEIEDNNGELIIKPKDGQKGTATIEVRDEAGNLRYRYIVNVDGTKSAHDTVIENTYQVSVEGTFKVTRLNENDLQVLGGSNWVDIDTSKPGQWILNPTGPDAAGNIVTVGEIRDGKVVRKLSLIHI